MPSSIFYQELKKLEIDLTEQLSAVRRLLGAKNINPDSDIDPFDGSGGTLIGADTYDKENSLSKGEKTWEEYSLFCLKQIGGRGRSGKVATFAINNNPNLPKDTIIRAIRQKLSILAERGEIEVERNKNLKVGNVYNVKEPQ